MRIAETCPNCSKYIGSQCITYISTQESLNIPTGTPLDEVLGSILPALSGEGPPNILANYIGQLYIDTSLGDLYIAMSNTISNWGLIGPILTTTTTTTSA